MDDVSRLEKLGENNDGLDCNPRPYDVWNFAECYDLMGYEYKGRIPGQIALQLLYFFTEQGVTWSSTPGQAQERWSAPAC